VSEKLTEKFNYVIISQPNGTFLEIAKQRLSALPKLFPPGQFSYLGEGAETISVHAGSVDIITIYKAIHWTDTEAIVAEDARQLERSRTFFAI
jgi:hypothetical protein